ncbi:hypothetical protein AAL_07691 [Moelleriella libera RCEF 2490]|uniref:Uncharacterized protein n=1 Tax=Moelleriella libera RCEF 2490 TaxID=1081109 RepID=A0A167WXJ8_9HYPO|nr:hypothetical protein AAL_07691 [Moelleriella libera RCEF 2490]
MKTVTAAVVLAALGQALPQQASQGKQAANAEPNWDDANVKPGLIEYINKGCADSDLELSKDVEAICRKEMLVEFKKLDEAEATKQKACDAWEAYRETNKKCNDAVKNSDEKVQKESCDIPKRDACSKASDLLWEAGHAAYDGFYKYITYKAGENDKKPAQPEAPSKPAQPTKPAQPAQPPKSDAPAKPAQPNQPAQPGKPVKPDTAAPGTPNSKPDQPCTPAKKGAKKDRAYWTTEGAKFCNEKVKANPKECERQWQFCAYDEVKKNADNASLEAVQKCADNNTNRNDPN